MGQIRAQITTRSGPAGTKDAQPVVHGMYAMNRGERNREFITQLADVLQAAEHIARDGMVTEVAVLIYDPALVPSAN